MDFSSIVIMEKDKETNILSKELGSYKVEDGAEHITKTFCIEGTVNIFFDTNKDVEDWEYSAIYDSFNEDMFFENGFDIEFVDDEFNPTWVVKFPFSENHSEMESKVTLLCRLINDEFVRVFEEIVDKKEEFE